LKEIKKATELATTGFCQMCLTGAYEQNIVLDLGGMFDIGLSIIGDKSKQLVLYLVDGPTRLFEITNNYFLICD
jgi:hypothetical protein